MRLRYIILPLLKSKLNIDSIDIFSFQIVSQPPTYVSSFRLGITENPRVPVRKRLVYHTLVSALSCDLLFRSPILCPWIEIRAFVWFRQLLAIVTGLKTAATTIVAWECPVVLLCDSLPRHVLVVPLALDEANLAGGVRFVGAIFVVVYSCSAWR